MTSLRYLTGRRKRSPAHGMGFSLLELLVVISVIAVLSAMLLSVVRVVRDSARSTRCAGNLRQFGLAFATYVEDNEQRWPSGQWHQLIQDYLNPGGTIGNGSTIAAAYALCHCPAAPPTTHMGVALNATYSYTGHYWTSWLSGVPYYFAWQLVSNAPVIVNSLVLRPTEKCVLSESWDDTNVSLGQASWGKSQLNVEMTALMHHNGSNFLFADAHVQLYALPGFTPFTPKLLALPGGATEPMWHPYVATKSTFVR